MGSLDYKEPCDDECPIKKTAIIIEGKWTTLVIRELLPGKKRFSEIQRALTGISPKVLMVFDFVTRIFYGPPTAAARPRPYHQKSIPDRAAHDGI